MVAEAAGRDPPPPPPPPPTATGLDVRPVNTTCVAPDLAGGGTAVALDTPFPALPPFSRPTLLLRAPAPDGRWFVLEKAGRIRVFEDEPAADAAPLWLDISTRVNPASEGGLLGLAFDPRWPATPEVYLSYTGDAGGQMTSFVSRFVVDDTVAPITRTEEILLTVTQPFGNHDGGGIAFGPDGMLYLGLGDGGGAGDPQASAQDTSRLLGAFLRIDVVDVASPDPDYRIPADNPFAGNPRCGPGLNGQDCPEIHAWGFRNPWRWSFDEATGRLWAGDVGQDAWEEVDVVEAGGNYGWDCREGAHDFEPAKCAGLPLVEPVAEYGHALGNAVTGGFVARGPRVPALLGYYVFGDFGSGRIWTLRPDGDGGPVPEEVAASGLNIVAFAEDADGDLLVLDFGGTIRALAPAGGGPTPSSLELRVTTPLADTNGCDAAPESGDCGIPDARIIAPGEAGRSLVVARMTRRDIHGMPPLATSVVDTEGVALVSAWIDGLSGCR